MLYKKASVYLIYRYNFGDEEVRIWMGNPPDRRGMILSDFIKDYKHTALCVSDDLPESMKGLTFDT